MPEPGSNSYWECLLLGEPNPVTLALAPNPPQLLRFFEETAWVVDASIIPDPNLGPEFHFTMRQDQEGRVSLEVALPERGTVFKQLQELRKAEPAAPILNLVRKVKVSRYNFSSEKCPELRMLANQFLKIRISALPGSGMVPDPTHYQLLISTPWRNMKVNLIADCSDHSRHGKDLVAWSDRVHLIALKLIAAHDENPKH